MRRRSKIRISNLVAIGFIFIALAAVWLWGRCTAGQHPSPLASPTILLSDSDSVAVSLDVASPKGRGKKSGRKSKKDSTKTRRRHIPRERKFLDDTVPSSAEQIWNTER